MSPFEMLAIPNPPTFIPGHQLDAASLNRISEFNVRMRRLHNLTLHGPGIGSGMAVLGKKGDAQARAQPGYAIDCVGRELILADEYVMPVPRGVTASYYVTASFTKDSAAMRTPSRTLPGQSPGTIRLIEQASIAWVQLTGSKDNLAPVDVAIGEELKKLQRLVLARVDIQDSKIVTIQTQVRCSARMQSSLYTFSAQRTFKAIGDKPVVIPTDGAGFSLIPIYFVQLVGANSGSWTAHVVEAERHQFSVRVVLRDQPMADGREAEEIEHSLFWIGIEGAI